VARDNAAVPERSTSTRRAGAALLLVVATATGTAVTAPATALPPVVRFRPVLAELPPSGGPQSVTQAEADAITTAIASCDASAVLALPVVATATAADDIAGACLVLPTSASFGDARFYLGPARLEGHDIAKARRRFVHGQGHLVEVQLTKGGKRRFDQLTAELFQKKAPRNQLAITVDGSVVSAPSVKQKRFPDGALQISGDLNRREARDLAAALSAGGGS
jgi:preprotein translocase subunit SecD